MIFPNKKLSNYGENQVPNICENELSIYADGDDQEALLKKLTKQLESEESVFDFNKLVPSPDWDNTPNEDGELPVIDEDAPEFMHVKKFPSSGKSDDRWYNWNCDNWGTKWNSFNAEREICEYGDHVQFKFQTAWCAPVEILLALREQYPDLQFNWFYRIEEWEDCGFLHREV